jgi:hypothetical protein
MPEPQRSIFREEAVRRYLHGRDESVFPRFVSPRSIAFLWVLLALLAAGGGIAWWAKVPVYASGPAVALEGPVVPPGIDEVAVVAFLPKETLPRLEEGQRLFLKAEESGDRRKIFVREVDPRIYSPNAAQRRFRLVGGAAAAVTSPTVAVRGALRLKGTDLTPQMVAGTVYKADVEVGSRRVISLLPLVGGFFGRS